TPPNQDTFRQSFASGTVSFCPLARASFQPPRKRLVRHSFLGTYEVLMSLSRLSNLREPNFGTSIEMGLKLFLGICTASITFMLYVLAHFVTESDNFQRVRFLPGRYRRSPAKCVTQDNVGKVVEFRPRLAGAVRREQPKDLRHGT